jgi:hypothetical protein
MTGWDIRFGIPFREWRVPSKSPIYDIVPNHSWGLGSSSNITNSNGANSHSILCACGPGDFQAWDLERGQCMIFILCVIWTSFLFIYFYFIIIIILFVIYLFILFISRIPLVLRIYFLLISCDRYSSVYDGGQSVDRGSECASIAA